MTAGIQCDDQCGGRTLLDAACAWSERFVGWLRRSFDVRVCHANLARGGTDLSISIAMLSSLLSESPCGSSPDLVLTDWSVNDVFQPTSGLALRGSFVRPHVPYGVLMETLILTLRGLAPEALHIHVIDDCPVCVTREGIAKLESGLPALRHHEIATINILHACAAGRFCVFRCVGGASSYGPEYGRLSRTELMRTTWQNCQHPTWRTHQAIADAVAFAVSSNSRSVPLVPALPRTSEAGRGTLFPLTELEKVESCLRPVTVIDAHQYFARRKLDLGADLGGDWLLSEDRQHKPGWIASRAGSRHRFRVRFGARPALAIMYVRSYGFMGNATFRLNGITSSSLVAHWNERLSGAAPVHRHHEQQCALHACSFTHSTHEIHVIFPDCAVAQTAWYRAAALQVPLVPHQAHGNNECERKCEDTSEAPMAMP